MRGVNAVKSTRLLLEHAHWESAAGPVRQLFELLINLEHIAADPDRDAAVFRYAKFGAAANGARPSEPSLHTRKPPAGQSIRRASPCSTAF